MSRLGLPDFLQQNTGDFCLSVTFVNHRVCDTDHRYSSGTSYRQKRNVFASLTILCANALTRSVQLSTFYNTVVCNNKNLAIAKRSLVSCAQDTLRASIGKNITP